jgi:hypothetical protein
MYTSLMLNWLNLERDKTCIPAIGEMTNYSKLRYSLAFKSPTSFHNQSKWPILMLMTMSSLRPAGGEDLTVTGLHRNQVDSNSAYADTLYSLQVLYNKKLTEGTHLSTENNCP